MTISSKRVVQRIFYFDGAEVELALIAWLRNKGIYPDEGYRASTTAGGGSTTITFQKTDTPALPQDESPRPAND